MGKKSRKGKDRSGGAKGGVASSSGSQNAERPDSKQGGAAAQLAAKKSLVSREFDRHVRPYIDLIDSLRSLGLDEDVNLPSVVVIGDQSSGKSSVLEAISGVQLPRGTGIVTRCALELRMKKMKMNHLSSQASLEEDGELWKAQLKKVGPSVCKDTAVERLKASADVGDAVRRAQNELAGEGNDICNDGHILLEVESPFVPDLTLIDLPGIARVAGFGQAEDIEEQTKSLIKHYIEKRETIILCVIPCNVDIATTEALKMAKRCDRKGERTLGVMTKPDLVDAGAERGIVEIAENRADFQLKLGFTLVKCRGQKDINEGITLKDALKSETKFFKSHEQFKSLYSDGKTGIEKLAVKLTRQLVLQIRHSLPRIVRRVTEMRMDIENKLRRLGELVPEDKRLHLAKILQEFSEAVTNSGSGIYDGAFRRDEKIYASAHGLFSSFLEEIQQLQPGLRHKGDFTQKIEDEIRNSRGQELPGFPSFGVFKSFAVQSVEKMEEPAMFLLDNVHNKVRQIVRGMAEKRFHRFPCLLEEVRGKIDEYLAGRLEEARIDIETTFKKEKWVFTQDANFSGLLYEAQKEEEEKRDQENEKKEKRFVNPAYVREPVEKPYVFGRLPQPPMTQVVTGRKFGTDSHEQDARDLFKKLLQYFKVAQARLCDSIPMTVYYYLISSFSENVKFRLQVELTNDQSSRRDDSSSGDGSSSEEEDDEDEEEISWFTPDELLKEKEDLEDNRKMLTNKLERVKKAEKRLGKFCGDENEPTSGEIEEGEEQDYEGDEGEEDEDGI